LANRMRGAGARVRATCPHRATEVDVAPNRLSKDISPPEDTSLETILGAPLSEYLPLCDLTVAREVACLLQ
jgi:hypothetical protein